MTRKYLCLLMILLMAMLTAACSETEPEPEETAPTLPAIREEWTPLQQLQDALDQTREQGCYTIRYGTIITRQDDKDEAAQTQSVTPQTPVDLEAIYQYLPQLPSRGDFLENFCNQPLRAVPSNTGVIRYLVSNLEWEEASQLLYGKATQPIYEAPLCQLTLEVDELGRLTGFELEVAGEEEQVTYYISITFAEKA